MLADIMKGWLVCDYKVCESDLICCAAEHLTCRFNVTALKKFLFTKCLSSSMVTGSFVCNCTILVTPTANWRKQK